jgi:hypothetical protein
VFEYDQAEPGGKSAGRPPGRPAREGTTCGTGPAPRRTALARRYPCIAEHLRCGSAAGGWRPDRCMAGCSAATDRRCPRGRRCPPRRASARARRRTTWWRSRRGSADPVAWAGPFGGPLRRLRPAEPPTHRRPSQRRREPLHVRARRRHAAVSPRTDLPEGHKTSDRGRDQVFLRVRSTCFAVCGHDRDPGRIFRPAPLAATVAADPR